MPKWKPQSCACIIEVDQNFEFLDYIEKCELHKRHSGKQLLREIHKHQRAIINKHGQILIPHSKIHAAKGERLSIRKWAKKYNDVELLAQLSKLDELWSDVVKENKRIKKLGPGERNPKKEKKRNVR